MDDRDGKKPFVIPKTHSSTKDIIISEKLDSRNVIELFNDVKSCAFEAQFNFRQNECKSCDTIRNQKLQKLYNEKRIKMKKDQDPIERLAFHLIAYRDVALNVANDGLHCEQLSFPVEKYIGNPKDGVHLSRRPDVLLTSSGAQGLYRFGLLVCKILLAKGYATIPSINNKQLSAQVHYDHHFCKTQSTNKEQYHIDDLLANSLIFCYEHENLETIQRPSQILPIAILWYDLTEKFPLELISTNTIKTILNKESLNRNGNTNNKKLSLKKKTSASSTKAISSQSNKSLIIPLMSNLINQDPTSIETIENSNTTELSTIKYPSHFMIPYNRIYSNPSLPTSSNTEQQQQQQQQQITNSRDPRLLRPKRETKLTSSETIPLSPQNLISERSINPLKSSSLIYIPLNSATSLIDPRLKTLKNTRNIFYLELQAVKHAIQQQKRLNHYCDSKNGLTAKTTYTVVPFLMRQVLNEEYERLLNDDNSTYKFHKHTNGTDYSLLYISVIDCFNFGFTKPTKSNQTYIDLEENENKLAYELMDMSNELIQREKQLNSQHIRLRLREKRQRKMQQQINEKKNLKSSVMSPSASSLSLPNSKLYLTTGKQLLKEHKLSTKSSNTYLSPDLLDFFSREYKNENRPYVKHLLAELVGIFIDKYHIEHKQIIKNNDQNQEENHNSIKESTVDDQTINSVIDMDIDSPSSQTLCDHDERFRIPTPPPLPPPLTLPPLPPINETLYSQPITSPFIFNQTFSNETNKMFDDRNALEQYQQRGLLLSSSHSTIKSESIIPSEDVGFKACLDQYESSSNENSPNDDLQQEDNILLPLVQNSSIHLEDDSNRSRDEFVRLLTQEAYVSKSSSPAKIPTNRKHSYNYHHHCDHRRRSYDDHDNKKKTRSSTNKTGRHLKSPQKIMSSTRTVTLMSNENQNDLQDEPMTKRAKIDSLPPSLNTTDEIENTNETVQKDLSLKSIVTIPTNTRTTTTTTNSLVSITESSTTTKSSRSRSKSKDHHEQQRQSSTNLHNSSKKNLKLPSKNYSQSSRSLSISAKDKHRRHRQQQIKTRDEYRRERRKSSDLLNRQHKQYSNQLPDRHDLFNETSSYRNSLSSTYQQRNFNDLMLPDNLHHVQQWQPVRHKRFNYNHQSVADHPRFASTNILPTPTPLMDFHYSKSSTHRRSSSPMTMEDRNVNSSYYENDYTDRIQSTTRTKVNDSQPSNTIERLQMLLKNKTSESCVDQQMDYSMNETVKSSSKRQSDTIVQNNKNQSFTYNAAEKLLTMVQRLRNS